MKKFGTGALILLVAVIIAGLIPFDTTVAPEWKIQVVDENGKPYKNQLVRQFCESDTLGVSCVEANSHQHTDENGYVVFPERKIRLSLLLRIVNSVIMFVVYLIAHGSLGTSVSVDSSGPQKQTTLEYISGQPLPEKLVLLSEPE